MIARRLIRFALLTLFVISMVPAVPLTVAADVMDYPVCWESSYQYNPRIDGDRVIWSDPRDDYDIYMYDFSTGLESQLTTTPIEQSDAEISGDWIAYYESDGVDRSIKAMNVVTQEVVDVWVGKPGYMQRPKIDGDVVVWEYADALPGDMDIWAYDLSTDTSWTVAATGGDERFPIIGGGKIVYNYGGWWSYDLGTQVATELTTMPGSVNVLSTAADDQHVVFTAGDGVTFLYTLDLTTSEVETLTTTVEPSSSDFVVDIDGDTVVFCSEDNLDGVNWTYSYSLASGTDQRVSSVNSDQFSPHISGSTIVWRDDRNGNTDIYTNRFIPGFVVPTSSISGTVSGWATFHPVEISLEATPAAGSTVRYLIDGEGPYTYSDVIGFDNAGEFVLEYWAQSAAGREDTKTVTIRLDWIAPSTTAMTTLSSGSAEVVLNPSDPHSGIARTYMRLDGGTWRKGTAVTVTTIGGHTLEYYSVDVAGNIESVDSEEFTVSASSTKSKTALDGTDRYKTAVKTSVEAFPDGIVEPDYQGYRTAVLATGNNWPDALGAASLAGVLGGPILLTDSKALPAAVATEIGRLNADRVIIIGGESAVSASVATAVGKLAGIEQVERLSGANRYATARLVARRAVQAQGAEFDGTAIITTGDNFPDALAGSPVAAHTGWPIYLMGNSSFDPGTADQLAADGVTKVYLLGGTSALPTLVETTIEARTSISVSPSDRIAGSNRYQTAARVAQMGVDDAGLFWDDAALATGDAFPDALAGGVMQGRLGSVVLLTTSKTLHAEAQAKLVANKSGIDEIRFLGGLSALSQSVRDRAWQVIQ